ncbi:glycosyltransferase family 4 protein [Taibaiella helva]|uniref:glycosyltransferase family 4 protein n=1 Tax=Taibaiella helva TaxID=2301235 RepID=UPI000E580E0E|nr:glycosyltransferase family 1 protein [Taibaiella helva]
MRIAVNTRLFLKGKLEGIGWFAHETLTRLVRQHPEHEFIFFFDRPYHKDFVFAPNVTPVVLKPQARHPALYVLWTEWAVPYALRKYRADIYFSPDGLGTLRSKVPTCITIHDLAYRHYPQFMDKLHKWHYAHYLPRFAQKARRIVAVSEYTRQDIVKQYGIPEDKIDVVYNGAHEAYKPLSYDEKEQVKAQYTEGEEFFLFTGALHPRKNVVNLLKAFVQFKRRQRSPIKLVIVGRMAWQYDEIAKARELMPYKEDVIWTGYLNVEDLARVTASAYALVYPSLFEGFGIPILEAMTCDVPVIVSNTSSMPEVGGDAALLVDPASPEDIAAKMMQIYKDETLRQKMIEAARIRKQQFSWERSAQQLWESLMKCL